MDKTQNKWREQLKNKWVLAFIGFIIIMFSFLCFKASNEDNWSDWGFGDAQTMLSLNQWQHEGWVKNYLLFIPQGYIKGIEILDTPQLRHHAHGTMPRAIEPKLWYTHYPAGYLIPYATLFKLGINNIFAMRILSILFSLGAICLMFTAFSIITRPSVAFIASVFYGLSPVFLNYAHSLANQPVDDFFRFLCMLLVVLSTRSLTSGTRRAFLIAAWIAEFTLSLASLDSVFFVYAWLIGWDILEQKSIPWKEWKKYLIFATGPILAQALLVLQNIWYMGADKTFLDMRSTYFARSDANNLILYLLNVIIASLTVIKNVLPVLIVVLLLLNYKVLRNRVTNGPEPRLLKILFLCGFAYVILLPIAAFDFPYQGRQLIPFLSLLVAGTIAGFASMISLKPRPYKELIFCGITLLIFGTNFAYNNRPSEVTRWNRPVDKADMLFSKDFRSTYANKNAIIFDMDGYSTYWNRSYVPGYPQIHPILEYYSGNKPILCFSSIQYLAEDLTFLINNNKYKFHPVIIARNPVFIERALSFLELNGVITKPTIKPIYNNGKYMLDIAKYVEWGNNPNKPQ